jgi:eukaryotic-like serine/threonine-protein kinase
VIGQTLGHYRIEAKLGEGGMGVVYRARDLELERTVALKLIEACSAADETARARLLREARSASALNHPNICTIYEVGEAGGEAYIAIEYVEGRPLSVLVPAGGLPVEKVLRYGIQIADALAHAHDRGVIHRDLKSSNVVVTADGRAKILDFGLAKRFEAPQLDAATRSQVSLTQTGAIVGTLGYMAPEILKGRPATPQSDVWALGVMMFEMVSGRLPFKGQTGFELSSAILREPPSPFPTTFPSGLKAIIQRSLAKEPGERYQRAGELRAALEAIQPGTATAAEVRGATRERPPRKWLAPAAALATALATFLVLVALNVGGLRERLRGHPASPRIESLAVLPLENLSHDPEQEYFADGMTEELITDLSKIGALRVISRTSVMHYKGTQKTVPEIARELHVDAVVEGSVARSGNRVRITAQLIHASSDTHLWADNFERDMKDVLALQDEVARDIANKIQVKLTPQEQARLTSARPVDPEAHELYLKGRYYWSKRTPDALRKSLEYFQQAVEKDTGYPLAYAGLADCYDMMAAGNYSILPSKEAYPKAEAAARKALELDNTLAEAHTSLAWSKLTFDWDWQGAEREFKQAIELNPGYANAHHWYALYLTIMGRHTEAIAEDRRAESLDPFSLIISTDLGFQALGAAGLYDQEIEQCRKTLEMDPNFANAYNCLADGYLHKRMYKEAIAEIQKAVELSGQSTLWVSTLASTYGRAGRRDEAIKILNQLKARSKREFVSPDLFALVYSGLGDKGQAFVWLEKAYVDRAITLFHLKFSPLYACLRPDPRYADLLRRIGLAP